MGEVVETSPFFFSYHAPGPLDLTPMDPLLELDRELFIFINDRMSNPVFDVILPIATDLHKQPLFWVVVVLIVAASVFVVRSAKSIGPEAVRTIRTSRAKRWAHGVLILGLSMGLSDLVAYRGVKVWVERDRPEAAGVPVNLRTHSHSGWSFPSNHAANNFALARTVQILAPTYAIPAYVFATVVGLSRTYVGVHYPLDVAGGALIGFLCASLIGWISKSRFRRAASNGCR